MRLENMVVEAWDRILDINAKGVFLGTKATIPEMRRAGGGSIINISSVYGLVGSGRSSAYHASKGAVRLLTKSLLLAECNESELQVWTLRDSGQTALEGFPQGCITV